MPSPFTPPTIPSGGSSSVTLVYDSGALGADTASIDTGAGGISGAYSLITIYVTARTDEATSQSICNVTLNNDTSALYDLQRVSGTNVTASAAAGVAGTNWALIMPGTSLAANVPGVWVMTFPLYAAATFTKTGTMVISIPDSTAGNNFGGVYALGYRSTTAISRFKVAANGAQKLKTGSRVMIYGTV